MTAQALQLLLVEDNPAHAELIRRAFLACDRPVALTVARSLHEARATLATALPDLAIIDLLLPDGRGLELLPGADRDVAYPAVLMTSYGNEQAAVEAIKTGAVGRWPPRSAARCQHATSARCRHLCARASGYLGGVLRDRAGAERLSTPATRAD